MNYIRSLVGIIQNDPALDVLVPRPSGALDDLVKRSPPPKLCSFGNYNKVIEMSYYHGLISSRRASALLTSQGDGSFLIRDSQSQPGSFVLSVKSVSLHVSTLIARLTVSLSSSHV